MTVRKRWPNNAQWARDDTAALIQESIRKLRPLLQHSDIKVVAIAGQVIDKQQRAARYLIQVGAPLSEDEL